MCVYAVAKTAAPSKVVHDAAMQIGQRRCGGGVCTKIEGTDDYSTAALWDLLIYPNPNVFLVVSGHSSCENHQIDYNVADNPVQQVVIDYQYKKNGGDGMLKIVRFEPEQNRINFQTYSPWFDSSIRSQKQIHIRLRHELTLLEGSSKFGNFLFISFIALDNYSRFGSMN